MVYSNRWGHSDKYRVVRTANGWEVSHLGVGGPCNKKGAPFLYSNLDHDGIEYPTSLGDGLEFLWEQARQTRMSARQVQQALNSLAYWVRVVEYHIPGRNFWARFKERNRSARL